MVNINFESYYFLFIHHITKNSYIYYIQNYKNHVLLKLSQKVYLNIISYFCVGEALPNITLIILIHDSK